MEEHSSFHPHQSGPCVPSTRPDVLFGLLRPMQGIHYAKGSDGQYLAASDGFCELIGIALEGIVGRSDSELHIEDHPMLKPWLDELVISDGVTRTVGPVEGWPRRGYVSGGLRKAPIHDARGCVVGVLCSEVDPDPFPAGQSAEERLEAAWEAIFEGSLVGLAQTDLSGLKSRLASLDAIVTGDVECQLREGDGGARGILGLAKVIAVNRACVKRLGDADPDRSRVTVSRLLAEDRQGAFIEGLKALAARTVGRDIDGTLPVEDVGRCAGRRTLLVMPGHEDDWSRVLMNIEELMDVMSPTAPQSDRDARYLTLFEAFHDAVVLADFVTGAIVDANRRAEDLFGRPRTELCRMRLVDLHPSDQGERYARMLGAWPGPTVTEPFIGEVLNASGDRIAAVISYAAFDDGGERRVHGIYTDLTASREAEHSIAEQRNRAEFYLDLMAHDVNNLSQGIVTAMELMKGNRQVPMNMVKYIELTLRLTGRITNIVASVRRLSHLADEEMLLSRQDALDLLSVATRRVVRAYPHKDIHIDLPQPAPQVLVMGNELLADVFTNILDNAVKFDRHVCIDIGVAVRSIGGGKAWRLEVRDQGPGVPDSMKERIFHRLDRTNVVDRGSGLGLTFVDVVVRRLGGRVWVEDRVKGTPSKGSCFIVELPAAR